MYEVACIGIHHNVLGGKVIVTSHVGSAQILKRAVGKHDLLA